MGGVRQHIKDDHFLTVLSAIGCVYGVVGPRGVIWQYSGIILEKGVREGLSIMEGLLNIDS